MTSPLTPAGQKDWAAVLLRPTKYGLPTDAGKARFNQEINRLPEDHVNLLHRGETGFYMLRQGQGLIQTGIHKNLDPENYSGLQDLAASAWGKIYRKTNGQPPTAENVNVWDYDGFLEDYDLRLYPCGTPDANVTWGAFAKARGLPSCSRAYNLFLKQIQAYNSSVQEFKGKRSISYLEHVKLLPNQLYLIPNYCLVDENAYSNETSSGESIFVPQSFKKQAQNWDTTSATTFREENCIVTREEVHKFEQQFKMPLLHHEIGHALKFTLGRLDRSSEHELSEACLQAYKLASQRKGLFLIMPYFVPHMAQCPTDEPLAFIYSVHNSGLHDTYFNAIQQVDPDVWNAYHKFLADLKKVA